jgi:hypothetical protein
MPTPIPLSTWPGNHCVRKAGLVPTWVAYQTYPAAQISAPGTMKIAYPRFAAIGPRTAATTAAMSAAGTSARPARSTV